LHPQSTAWSLYDDRDVKDIEELNEKLLSVMRILESKHISFHFGDEIIMERHGKVENGKLVIGNCSYSYVVDPGCEVLFENTKELLSEFQKIGGRIVSAEELSDYIENGNITNSVNLPNVSMPRSGALRICIIHKNIPTILTQITQTMGQDNINIENMLNKSKKEYAYTLLDINDGDKDKLEAELKAIDGVIRVRIV